MKIEDIKKLTYEQKIQHANELVTYANDDVTVQWNERLKLKLRKEYHKTIELMRFDEAIQQLYVYPENYPENFNADNLNTSINRVKQRQGKIDRVIFTDILPQLLDNFNNFDFVIGCVGWVDHPEFFDAVIDSKIECNLIVNKEEHFRSDYVHKSTETKQYKMYKHIQFLNTFSRIGGIECCGSSSLLAGFMHHKFLLFGHFCDGADIRGIEEVWTGSFNITHNTPNNLENMLVSTNLNIIREFYHEYCSVKAIAEPFDWKNARCEPDPDLFLTVEPVETNEK